MCGLITFHNANIPKFIINKQPQSLSLSPAEAASLCRVRDVLLIKREREREGEKEGEEQSKNQLFSYLAVLFLWRKRRRRRRRELDFVNRQLRSVTNV